MFYHPSSDMEFSSLHEFRMAFRDTSFGDLTDEAERNASGLYTLSDEKPEYDPNTHTVESAGFGFTDGRWARLWQIVPLPIEEVRQNLVRATTALRWQHETGGLTLQNGVSVGTSIDDQNRLTSVIANAKAAGVETVDFKASSGWTTLAVQDIQLIAIAIARHVQACFSAERAHHEAIQSATDEALMTYDIHAGWPTTTN